MTPTQAAEAVRDEAGRRAEIHTLGMDREHSKRLIAAIRSIPIPAAAAPTQAAAEAMREAAAKIASPWPFVAAAIRALPLPTEAAEPREAEAEKYRERPHKESLELAQAYGHMQKPAPIPTEAAEPGAAEAALACGHHASLAVRNIESAVVSCELCEARDELRDAVTMERSLSNDVRTLRADLARMKSALGIAREALEPFANEADCYDSEWSDNIVAKDFRHIAIGSLRCAASALTVIDAALQEPTNANR